MFHLSDADSVVRTAEVSPASKDALNSDDAYIIDIGKTIFVWVGKNASKVCMCVYVCVCM